MEKTEVIVLLTIGIGLAVLALIAFIFQRVEQRTKEMARRVARNDALLSETCMLRYGWRECPAFIQLTSEMLHIDAAFFNIHLAIPLSGLTLLKFVGGAGRFTGQCGWIGKYRLQLNAPGLAHSVVLGVKRGEEWRRALAGHSLRT